MSGFNFINIDGSVLEGGGQILRNAVSLSAILGIPVRVFNIRAARSKPGLAAQHLKGIQLVANMCRAKVKGAQLASAEIEFSPGKIKGGHYIADTQTAGSISLLLQVALPVAFFADGPVTLELKGGTNADMAPQIDFMKDIFRHNLRKFHADFSLDIKRRGYFPKGGGHVTVEVIPIRKLHCVDLTDPGTPHSIMGKSFVAGVLPLKMAHQMAEGAKQELLSECKTVNIYCYKETSLVAPDNCSGIILSCELTSGCMLGSDALCKRGADPVAVGRAAGQDLRVAIQTGVCVDAHVQDQLIIYMALAEGHSKITAAEITMHTKTSIFIAEKIAQVKFNVINEASRNDIECTGLGVINRSVPS